MAKRNKGILWSWLIGAVCIIVILICLVNIVFPDMAAKFFGVWNSKNSAESTAKREALPLSSIDETVYFTNDSHYLQDPILIEEGLKHFYELTGVQPYLHFETSTGFISIYGDLSSHRNLVAYSRFLYSTLFTDESHLLVVTYADYNIDAGRYEISLCTIVGSEARKVIDGDAEKILTDRIEFYFNKARWPSEEIFSNAFSDAADQIMGVASPQPNKTVFIIRGALALLVLLVWLSRIKKKRKLKEQQDKEILSKPLEEYGADIGNEADKPQAYGGIPEDEAETLAKKYNKNNG